MTSIRSRLTTTGRLRNACPPVDDDHDGVSTRTTTATSPRTPTRPTSTATTGRRLRLRPRRRPLRRPVRQLPDRLQPRAHRHRRRRVRQRPARRGRRRNRDGVRPGRVLHHPPPPHRVRAPPRPGAPGAHRRRGRRHRLPRSRRAWSCGCAVRRRAPDRPAAVDRPPRREADFTWRARPRHRLCAPGRGWHTYAFVRFTTPRATRPAKRGRLSRS